MSIKISTRIGISKQRESVADLMEDMANLESLITRIEKITVGSFKIEE